MKSVEKIYGNAIKALKKRDVRITPQRQIVLKYLISHHNHPSVETIYRELRQKFSNLSMATVYNSLKMLKKAGIIIELPSKNGGLRYDFYGQPHMHAICERCGRIYDVKDPRYQKLDRELQALTVEKTGFKVDHIKVEVFGLCPICQRELKNLK